MLNPEITANLAELDALFAASTQGEWEVLRGGNFTQIGLVGYREWSKNAHYLGGPLRVASVDISNENYDTALSLSRTTAESIAALHNAYPTLRQHIAAQAARIAELEGDTSKWRAAVREAQRFDVSDLGTAKGCILSLVQQNEASRDQLTASQAQNAGLREALEDIGKGNWVGQVGNSFESDHHQISGRMPDKVTAEAWAKAKARTTGDTASFGFAAFHFDLDTAEIKDRVDAALAATPVASLAMVKASALREFADEIFRELDKSVNPAMMAFEVSLRERADQLEAAAKGEKDA